MRMGTLPTLGTSQLGAWAARNAVIGLGLSLFAVLCAACYKTADLNGSDRNGKDASLLDDARQPHDTYPDTNETNHDTTESQDAPDDDTAELASDDGEPLPPSFCSGRDSGETEKMAELIYPGNSIAVDDKSVYIAGEYEDYMGGTIWRIDKADGEKPSCIEPVVDPPFFDSTGRWWLWCRSTGRYCSPIR